MSGSATQSAQCALRACHTSPRCAPGPLHWRSSLVHETITSRIYLYRVIRVSLKLRRGATRSLRPVPSYLSPTGLIQILGLTTSSPLLQPPQRSVRRFDRAGASKMIPNMGRRAGAQVHRIPGAFLHERRRSIPSWAPENNCCMSLDAPGRSVSTDIFRILAAEQAAQSTT